MASSSTKRTANDSSSYVITSINETLPSSLKQCTSNHLIAIIKNHASFNNDKINPYKTTIIEYLKANQVDGNTLSFMNRKAFSMNLISYTKDKKIRTAANTTYNTLVNHFQVENVLINIQNLYLSKSS